MTHDEVCTAHASTGRRLGVSAQILQTWREREGIQDYRALHDALYLVLDVLIAQHGLTMAQQYCVMDRYDAILTDYATNATKP